MKKGIIAVFSALILTINTVNAAVLGTEIKGWSLKFAKNTEFYKTEFISDQSGVGKQTEYYAKYTPNSEVVPTVIGGNTVWGTRNIKSAEEYMKNNGLVPLIGINASFFSFETGIPMGASVSDGRIITKDTEEYQAVGFNSDGTAFIAPLKITTILKFDDSELEISHINKYNQETTPIINLYTPDFDENNHNEIPSLTLILDELDGNLGIGETVSAVVSDKFNYHGAIKIPEGQFLLTLNENSDELLYEQLNSLEVGDRVEIYSYTEDTRWEKVDSLMGSVGERIIESGIVKESTVQGSAPRTAFGITNGGELIFYVLDGRQQGYSYGAKVETIAERLKELGCVDAINLDGGGSTSMSGIYPGATKNEVLNSPSGSSLRKCANYIFLKNTASSTGILGGIYLYPFEEHYLSGYEEVIAPKAVDTNFYPMAMPEGVKISVTGGDALFNSEKSSIKALGTGKIEITASFGDVSTKSYYHSYETPTDIIVKDENGNELNSLMLKKDDTKSFNFEAWYNGIKLKANEESFLMSVNEEIGYTEGNKLTITSNSGGGVLCVKVGERIKEIPITIESVFPFSDISNHWAKEQIKYVYDEGIVSGYETESGLSFLPLKNITREEFAVIMCRMLGVDVSKISECNKDFTDLNEISDWSRQYVYAMVNKGIIAGKQGLEEKLFFAPKVTLTRAEAITILSRVLNIDEVSEDKFDDDSDIPSWAKEAVYMMVKRGFISGYPDNTIRPNANVTRAEAAAMIYNIISKSF